MRMTMEIEVGEIRNHLPGTDGRDFTRPHKTSEALNNLNVHEMWRVKFVVVAKEAGFDTNAKWGLQ